MYDFQSFYFYVLLINKKTKTMKTKLLYVITLLCLASQGNSQNWQYVGNAFIHNATTTAINFPDMEISTSGDVYVGYASGTGSVDLKLAKFSGGTWTQLSSPAPTGTTVNAVDIELQGTDCYFAYTRNKNNNYYIYLSKYNGSTWTPIGDSLLLGYIGNGGFFDLVIDNNGVPTILGITGTSGKDIKQFKNGSWSTLISLAGSASTVFQENSAFFDSQNKLYCATTCFLMSPVIGYFTVIQKIDAGTRSTVGDTIPGTYTNGRIKFDASGTPYYSGNGSSRVMAYKLNGTKWGLMGDTTKIPGLLTCSAVTGDGKMVFCAMGSKYRTCFYEGNTMKTMDSIVTTGLIGGLNDLIIPAGSNDAYVLILEVKLTTATSDLSVMKHAVTAGATGLQIAEANTHELNIFPNPATSTLNIQQNGSEASDIYLTDLSGRVVLQTELPVGQSQIDISSLPKGLYFIRVGSEVGNICKKLIIQ